LFSSAAMPRNDRALPLQIAEDRRLLRYMSPQMA
jgi:hypothetical protein